MKFNRAILKISGEALAGNEKLGYDINILKNIANEVKKLVENNKQIGIVVGGGNIIRGRDSIDFTRNISDTMGMLSTTINGLAVSDALTKVGLKNVILTATKIDKIGKLHDFHTANEYLNRGYTVIFTGGTGNPYFSTDSCVAIRAGEINADIVLFGKTIDGVYDSDPKINKQAKKYSEISYNEIIDKRLGIVDSSAAILLKDLKINSVAFDMRGGKNISKILESKDIGTLITY